MGLPDVTSCFIKHADREGQEREYVSNMDVTIECDLIMGVASHHFGLLLQVRSKSQVAPTLKGILGYPMHGHRSRG